MGTSNHTKAYYEKKARIWLEAKTHSFHHEKQFRLFSELLQNTARDIVDIGCAGGIHVPLFLGIGRKLRYFGIDVTSAFLKVAERRYPQLTFRQGDIADYATLPRKKFDGFWAAAVLMHIPYEQWDMTFSNLEKMTKSQSLGYITLPTEHPSGHKDDDVRYFTILTPQEQRAYIKSRNWKILKSGTIDGTNKKSIWRWYIVRLP